MCGEGVGAGGGLQLVGCVGRRWGEGRYPNHFESRSFVLKGFVMQGLLLSNNKDYKQKTVGKGGGGGGGGGRGRISKSF